MIQIWNCKNIVGWRGLSLPAEWLYTGAALCQRGQNWNWRTTWSLYKEELRMKDQIIGSTQSKTEAIKLSCMWKNLWAVRRYKLSCQCISFIEWWLKDTCFFFLSGVIYNSPLIWFWRIISVPRRQEKSEGHSMHWGGSKISQIDPWWHSLQYKAMYENDWIELKH